MCSSASRLSLNRRACKGSVVNCFQGVTPTYTGTLVLTCNKIQTVICYSEGTMDAPFPDGMVEEIETFLAKDHERPSGLDLYEEVFATHTFFPLQRKYELREMMRLARSISPRVVMEIGTDKGGGLYHWCKCLPSVTNVIACEIRGVPYRPSFAKAFPHVGFLWLGRPSRGPSKVGDPTDTVDWVRSYLGDNCIDVLFIDGDKLGMEQDFDAYLPLMSPHGVVFFHDVQDREPKEAFERIQARGFRVSTIIDLTDTYESAEREKLGIPPANPHEAWLRHWKGRSCGVGVVFLSYKNEVHR